RGEANPFAELADVVDRAVRGGVHLDHVERGARRDRAARLALPTGRQRRALHAVEGPGEDLRHRGLAGPPRADEQVGVVDSVLLDRVRERPDDVLLTHHLREALRPVAAIKRGGLGHESSLAVAPNAPRGDPAICEIAARWPLTRDSPS